MAATVIGTGASISAQQEAAQDKKRTLLQGIEGEEKIQKQSNQLTDEYVKDTFDPTTRNANYETRATDREKALGDLLATQSASGQGGVNAAATGALSDSYTKAKASATATSADKARNLSRLLARSSASGNLLGQEALAGADYSSDMMGLNQQSQLNSRLTNSRYGAAGNSGSSLALLGGLLSGAGSLAGSYGGKVGYSGTQAPAPVTTIKVPA